jgi:subtilisin family serine protease
MIPLKAGLRLCCNFRVLASLLFLALLRPADAAAVEPRMDPRIFAGKAEGERAAFLVVLREQADLSGAASIRDRVARRRFVYEALREHAVATQAPLAGRLRAAGIAFRSHFLFNMLEVQADAAFARDLAARADVSTVEANLGAALTLPGPVPSPASRLSSSTPVEFNIAMIRAPELWSRGFTGQGIVVGIADTGFQWDHPALKARYRGWNGESASHDYNWHDAIHDAAPDNPCGSDAPAPCDDSSHGTATAGLSVGDDGGANRIGVAPGARLIGCRNMDQGDGTPARYTECFEWLLAPTDAAGENPRPDLGADVINNSWTCPASEGCTSPDILRSVVENVRAAGIAVVFAAGNSGSSCSTIRDAPAFYDAAITVGATEADDTIAPFSSIGPVLADGSNRLKPDLTAPGVRVRTAAPSDGYAGSFSGTSAAAPHVTGAVALLWSAFPALAGDVDRTEEALERGAAPRTVDLTCGGYAGAEVPNPVYGWGRLDVEGAYEWLAPPRSAVVPLGRRPPTRLVPARP